MITVYLSGKMTGLAESEYKMTFKRAEEFYKDCGYNVINPCDLAEDVLKRKPNATYEDFMAEDLKSISKCTHIAMLEGWETSPGAKREKAEAQRLGKEIMFLKLFGKR